MSYVIVKGKSKKAYENRYKPHDGVIIERYLWR